MPVISFFRYLETNRRDPALIPSVEVAFGSRLWELLIASFRTQCVLQTHFTMELQCSALTGQPPGMDQNRRVKTP